MSEADIRAPENTDTTALRVEAEQLRCQALADRRVLDKLQHIPKSGSASQTGQALRQRYEQAIERRVGLLEALLQAADVRAGELLEENLELRATVERLG